MCEYDPVPWCMVCVRASAQHRDCAALGDGDPFPYLMAFIPCLTGEDQCSGGLQRAESEDFWLDPQVTEAR